MRRSGYASPLTARFYDSQLALERRALRTAIALVAPRTEELVLDVATGTGALLRELAAGPSPPRRAIGVDASPAMLSHVPELPPEWTLVTADVRRLPIGDAGADVVTCAYLLHLLDQPDRHAVLREVARVLAPGGRAALVTLLMARGLAGAVALGPLQRGLCRSFGPESGWCALDPTDELAGAGLRLVRGRVCTRGYASLCLLVKRA